MATTVPSCDAIDLVNGLGADEVILYPDEPVDAYVARLTAGAAFDVVFDTVGGANLMTSMEAAASHGRLATTNARVTADLATLHAKALSLHVVFMLLPLVRDVGREYHGRIMQILAALADEGKLRPLLEVQRLTLDTAADAYRHLASGQAAGKVIVDIVSGNDGPRAGKLN